MTACTKIFFFPLLIVSFLTIVSCGNSYEVGDYYSNDTVKGIVVNVDEQGRPLMLLSIDEAIDIDADSAKQWAVALGSEWHLPTKQEMEQVKKYKSLINQTLERRKYNGFLTGHTFYWTSTPCSETHHYACGPDGLRCYFNTNHSHCYRSRAVCLFDYSENPQ